MRGGLAYAPCVWGRGGRTDGAAVAIIRRMRTTGSRAIAVSVTANAAICALLGAVSFGGCAGEPKETIVPVEFLVVTEENAADVLAERPNEAAEPEAPKPEPEPPRPEPKIPDPEPIPPPKPAPTPKAEPKPTPKPTPKPAEKPKYVQAKDIKIGKRVGPVTTGRKDRAKPPTAKRLSDAEIRRLLKAGARSGNVNQIPPNEASQCYAAIRRAFTEACANTLEGSPTGVAPQLEIALGAYGKVESVKVVRSSGSKDFDRQVVAACRRVKRIYRLPNSFVQNYPTVVIEVDVE